MPRRSSYWEAVWAAAALYDMSMDSFLSMLEDREKKSDKTRKIFTGYESKKGTPLGAEISRVRPDKNYILPTESLALAI
jgi:hypothetical protein